MNSMVGRIGAWFRKVYAALKNAEEALDYRFEDYAVERIKALERRMAALEDAARR